MTLSNPADVDALRTRLASLTPGSARQWGKMSIDQMLHHISLALEMALGTLPAALKKAPIPRRLLLRIAFHAPWPKGTPTAPELFVRDQYDFETERARCIALLDRVAAQPVDGAWPIHPIFARISGQEWKKLQALHTNHHLRQFSA